MFLKELLDSILEGKKIVLKTGEGADGWVELEYPKSFTILQLEEFLGYGNIKVVT